MNVGNQTAIINGTSDLFIYDAPSATGISKSNSPATGNVSIQIEGNQFGVTTVPVGVVVGKSLSPKSHWQSDSRIYFVTPPGTGVVDTITLSIIRLTLILEEVDAPIFYYDKPNINAIQAANSPTNAIGRYATVFGQNFGVSDQLVETSFGNAQYQSAKWISDSSIMTPVPAGYGDGKSLAVRVDSQIGEAYQFFSYDIATISMATPSNVFPRTVGKQTINGINFIFLDTTLTSQIGATPMESTIWISDTSTFCRVPSGLRGCKTLAITVFGFLNSISESCSFDSPSFSKYNAENFSISNLQALKGLNISINVSHFSHKAVPSAQGRMSGTALELTYWRDSFSIQCKLSRGSHQSLNLVITISDFPKSVTEMISYDSARISNLVLTNRGSMLPLVFLMQFFNNSRNISYVENEAKGSNFGLIDTSVREKLGVSTLPATTWMSDHSIYCKMTTGVSSTSSTIVTVTENPGSLSEIFSFNHQAISNALRSNGPRDGSSLVEVYGVELGINDYSSKISIGGCIPPFCRQQSSLSVIACSASLWNSDSILVCKPSRGLTDDCTVKLTLVQSVTSLSKSFSYDLWPILHPSQPTNSIRAAPTLVEVLGINLGLSEYSSSVRIGRTSSEVTRWISTSTILCAPATGNGRSLHIAVTVGATNTSDFSIEATVCDSFSYDATPILLSQRMNTGMRVKGGLTVLADENFLNFDSTLRIRIGFSDCEASEWSNTTAIHAKVSSGEKMSIKLALTICNNLGSITHVATYSSPSITQVSKANAVPQQSAQDLWILLSSLESGNVSYTAAVRIGISSSAKTQWLSDFTLTCLKSSSVSRSNPLQVSIFTGKLSSISDALTFDAPFLALSYNYSTYLRSSLPLHSMQFGNILVKVSVDSSATLQYIGGNFGHLASIGTRLLSTSSEETIWESDSTVRGKVPSGIPQQGYSRSLALTTSIYVGGSVTDMISLDSAVVSSVPTRNQGMIESGMPLIVKHTTVAGKSFGSSEYSILEGNIGLTTAESTIWSSESMIFLKTPSGHMRSKIIRITSSAILNPSATLSEAFSFDMIELGPVSKIRLNFPKQESTKNLIVPSQLPGFFTNPSSSVYHGKYSSMTLKLGRSTVESTTWYSESAIFVRPAAGTGFSQVLVVSNSMVRTALEWFSYDCQSIAVIGKKQDARYISGLNTPSTSSIAFAIFGSQFGSFDSSTSTRSCSLTASEKSEWQSDTYIVAQTASGSIRSRSASIVVTVFHLWQSMSLAISIDRITLSTMSGQNLPSFSNMCTTYGSNFGGQSDLTIRVRVHPTATTSTEWLSTTSLRARIAWGTFKFKAIELTVATNLRGSLTKTFSFDGDWPYPVKIQGEKNISSSNGPTINQNSNYLIIGSGFGLIDKSSFIGIGIGMTNSAETQWISDSEITCRLPSASVYRKMLDIVVDLQPPEYYINRLSQAFSYSSPSISSVSVSNFGVRSSYATISGSSYGADDGSIDARIGASVCENTIWNSDSALICHALLRMSGSQRLVVTAGSQGYIEQVWPNVAAGFRLSLGTLTDTISYDLISSEKILQLHVLATTSASSLEKLVAISEPYQAQTVTSHVRFSSTGSEATQWTGLSTIAVKSPSGVSASKRVIMTVGNMVQTLNNFVSYQAPAPNSIDYLESMNPSCTELYCGKNRTVLNGFGESFADMMISQSARMGQSSCSSTIWHSDTQVICFAANGLGVARGSVITVGVLVGSKNTAFTYYRKIQSVNTTDGKVSGNVSMTVLGTGFGSADYSPIIRIGNIYCDANKWISESSMICKVPVNITQAERLDITWLSCNKNDTCDESWVPILLLDTNGPTSGNVNLSISGLGFQSTRPKGIGKELNLNVNIEDVKNNSITQSSAFYYDSPSSSSVSPSNLPTTRLGTTTIFGSNFGSSDYTGNVFLSFSNQGSLQWVSESMVSCKSEPGVSNYINVTMIFGGMTGLTTMYFSFDAPELSTATGIQVNIASGDWMAKYVDGKSFGISDYSPAIRGGTAASQTVWLSDTAVLSLKNAHHGSSINVILTVSMQKNSLSEAISYLPPSIFGVPQNLAGTGSIRLFLAGRELGLSDSSMRVRIEGTSLEVTAWLSTSTVLSRSCSGSGEGGKITVTAGIVTGSQATATIYDASFATTVKTQNVHQLSSFAILQGKYFGANDLTVKVQTGTAMEQTLWLSDTGMICYFPLSEGKSKSLIVTVMSSIGTTSESLSADLLPLRNGINPFNQPSHTSDLKNTSKIFTVHLNATPGLQSVSFSIGGTSSESTIWTSASQIFVKCSDGVDRSKLLALSHVSSTSTVSRVFTYDVQTIRQTTFNAKVRIGSTTCEESAWSSDTTLSCLKPGSGVGHFILLCLTMEERRSTITLSFSYDGSVVILLNQNKSNLLTEFSGFNFGISINIVPCEFGYSSISWGHCDLKRTRVNKNRDVFISNQGDQFCSIIQSRYGARNNNST
eukprot:768441-Hanusia_phi.AAC.22